MRANWFLKQYPPENHSWAGKVNFGFSYPTVGWIQFTITCTTYLQGVILHCSNVCSPFPGLIRWLEDIAGGNLPSECVVDEEGQGKLLRATVLSEFLKRWDDFLENQYDPAQWEEHGETSLRTYNVSKIREFLQGVSL
jgi:hypothetical protein